jgi:hypothetical protein
VRSSGRRAACAFLAVSAVLAPLAAQEPPIALEIQPSLLELTPHASEGLTRTVTLVNSGRVSVSVVARVSDWAMDPAGQVSFVRPGRVPLSCAGWIRIDPERQIVPAGGRALARVTVQAPEAAAGTHWAAILFELPETDTRLEGRAVTVVPRVGLTLYVTPKGSQREDFDFEDVSASATGSGSATLRAAFANRGNTAVRARLDWQIKSSDGKFVRTYKISSVVALPGSRREAVANSDDMIPPGDYVVTAMARWGERRWASRDVALAVPRKTP